jgi:hypothetical protein
VITRLKQLFLTVAVSAILIYIVQWTLFDNEWSYSSISNAFFVVGLPMFFISLIGLTDADKIFRIAVYSFKLVRRKNRKKYSNYYEYVKDVEGEKIIPFAFEMMLTSIVYVGIAFYYSQLYLQTL